MARANLPTKLVIKPVFPVKTAVHKLTLDTNRPPASLNDLFPGITSKSVPLKYFDLILMGLNSVKKFRQLTLAFSFLVC